MFTTTQVVPLYIHELFMNFQSRYGWFLCHGYSSMYIGFGPLYFHFLEAIVYYIVKRVGESEMNATWKQIIIYHVKRIDWSCKQ